MCKRPPASLEVELQSHLDGSCGHRHTRDRAESGGRRDVAGRRREARMVWQVEELRAEQEILGFSNVELLADVKVQADEIRRVLSGLSRIAERACVGRAIDALTVVHAGRQADSIRRSEPMINALARISKSRKISVRPVSGTCVLTAGGT